ncbi:MAG TPA: hypothetical protein VLW17_12930 [Thermoanaerobaculaceae bacterium]|nr:hypothetical protein [Thermoanaerobaculaceae bacterium]
MRRAFLTCLLLLGASAALAANPYYLDRNGVLWKGTAGAEGLVLTGEQNGAEVVRSVVPFPLAMPGTSDTQIQVAADELTGKVAVVWQRNWNDSASEIMLAVWNGGSWERIDHLSQDLTASPRNPAIQLTSDAIAVPDLDHPDDPTATVTLRDSFLHVVWWEGTDQSHGTYALLRLTAAPDESDALLEQDLDGYSTLGLPCNVPVPPAALEHPIFANQASADRAVLFFGSQRQCLFLLLEVQFAAPAPPPTGGGVPVGTQRRRSVPIFGLMKVFPMDRDLDMDGTRVMLGSNLQPVAYRIDGSLVSYVTYGDQGWSPIRKLAVADGLSIDQAIPLVENLAR